MGRPQERTARLTDRELAVAMEAAYPNRRQLAVLLQVDYRELCAVLDMRPCKPEALEQVRRGWAEVAPGALMQRLEALVTEPTRGRAVAVTALVARLMEALGPRH